MEKEFVPYELALDLKELGMDLGWYNYLNFYDSSTKEFCFVMKDVPAPLYQQAFRWFREKHNMNHSIILHETTFSNDYQYLVLSNDNEFVEAGYNTYEEAELACLQKLIEIVKTK
jgi:regulatory protein YycH of two-component signal transduction system YycFG